MQTKNPLKREIPDRLAKSNKSRELFLEEFSCCACANLKAKKRIWRSMFVVVSIREKVKKKNYKLMTNMLRGNATHRNSIPPIA